MLQQKEKKFVKKYKYNFFLSTTVIKVINIS